jgi:hypothetical protein
MGPSPCLSNRWVHGHGNCHWVENSNSLDGNRSRHREEIGGMSLPPEPLFLKEKNGCSVEDLSGNVEGAIVLCLEMQE